jgi:hypothetical protein
VETRFESRPEIADPQAFYGQLFKPVEKEFGKLDGKTLTSIIGFSGGGPVSLSTVGVARGERFITYVSCELACYRGQKASSAGPYEVLITCNDQRWARLATSAVGEMSFEAKLDHEHSLDLGPRLEKGAGLQGVIFERFSSSKYLGMKYGIFRIIGVTRAELDWCEEHSVGKLLQKLKQGGGYPNTDVGRKSVI